jgi:hypothetical protein
LENKGEGLLHALTSSRLDVILVLAAATWRYTSTRCGCRVHSIRILANENYCWLIPLHLVIRQFEMQPLYARVLFAIVRKRIP